MKAESAGGWTRLAMPRPDPVTAARAWIGTPYIRGAALRGAGCDCVGLIRGVYEDVTGIRPPDPPGWRPDWFGAKGRPLVTAARKWLIETATPEPGAVTVFRVKSHEAHVGIMATPETVIHAVEHVGVVEVPVEAYRPKIVWCGHFPKEA